VIDVHRAESYIVEPEEMNAMWVEQLGEAHRRWDGRLDSGEMLREDPQKLALYKAILPVSGFAWFLGNIGH
jgi:hypothetical protein